MQGVFERVDDTKDKKAASAESSSEPSHQPALPIMPVISRPARIEGATYEVQTPVGDTFITINHTENKEPFEVFINIGKSGSDVGAMAESIGRLISLNLRTNSMLPPRERVRQIVAQLSGIGGARSVGFGPNRVRSLPDAIARVLSQHFDFAVNGKVTDKNVLQQFNNGRIATNELTAPSTHRESTENAQQLVIEGGQKAVTAHTNIFDICPECGVSSFAYEEGCKKCYSCGYSEC